MSHTFRDPVQQRVRTEILHVLATYGERSTRELKAIAALFGVFDGQAMGMITALCNAGDIERVRHSRYSLPRQP